MKKKDRKRIKKFINEEVKTKDNEDKIGFADYFLKKHCKEMKYKDRKFIAYNIITSK